MTTKALKLAGVATVMIGFLLTSVGAGAQERQAGEQVASEGEEPGNNYIVVTAQKREQDILEVPIAVSAFGAESLEAAQVTQFDDLTRLAPSLSITGDSNRNQQVVLIRGIGTFAFSTSAEPTVSVVVDNVALLQPGQAFGNLSDIGRVEVLRGPQGTLFGKNASAGVINIVTAGASDFLTGYVEGTLTTDDESRVAVMLSGPIGDVAGFRLNSYYYDRSGHLNNLTTGERMGAEDGFGIRGKFEISTGNLDATLIGDYSEDNSNSGAATFLTFPAGTLTNANRPVDLTGIEPGPHNRNLREDALRLNDTQQLLLAADLNYDLDFATLTSITSYQNWDFFNFSDGDQSPSATLTQGGPYAAEQFAQELRLTSPDSGPVTYQFGLYFADAATDRVFERNAPNFLAFLRQNWDSRATTTSYAAFSQLGFDLGSETNLTIGGRLNHERIGVEFIDNRTTPGVTYTGQASDTAFTWRASLQHFVSDEAMIFGSVATGYKGQAYDVSSGFNQGRADTPINPESSTSFELGVKGRSADGLASYSLVAFWTDYNDFQAQGVLNPTALVPDFQLVNVGQLRTRGLEFEGGISPADGLTFSGSAAYVDATIREYPTAQCYGGQTAAQGCVNGLQDLAGANLPNSPEFKFSLGGSYEFPVFGDFSGFVNANYTWQSEVNFGLANDPLTVQSSYGLANINFGLRDEDNRQLTFFVNNLFDTAYAGTIQQDTRNFNQPGVLRQILPRNAFRYFGVRLRVGF